MQVIMPSFPNLMSKNVKFYMNFIKSTHLAFNKVTEENVYNCVGHPSKNDMLNVINWLLNDDFSTIYQSESFRFIFLAICLFLKHLLVLGLIHLKTLRGYALQDILTEVSRFVQMSNIFYNLNSVLIVRFLCYLLWFKLSFPRMF